LHDVSITFVGYNILHAMAGIQCTTPRVKHIVSLLHNIITTLIPRLKLMPLSLIDKFEAIIKLNSSTKKWKKRASRS